MRNNSNDSNKKATVGRCRVCNHPDREKFDRALIMHEQTPADIARIIGCNRSTVTRHVQRHLLPIAAAEVLKADPDLHNIDIPGELRGLYKRIRTQLDKADSTDNWQAIRAFHSEARQDLELLGKLLGELDQQPVVNVLVTSNDWLRLRSAILDALIPYPEARIAVSEALHALPPG